MLTIYHNPRCTKSRQTLQRIEEKGKTVQVVEYLKTVPSKEELADLVDKLNIKPEQLIRKNEADYKDNFKGKQLTDDEWLQAMLKYPKLIERPIVVKGDEAIIGRPPENVDKLL